jgi:hypothetical protein
MIDTTGSMMRVLGIICTILGIFLLFMPLITLLNWIPLVGKFLGYAVALAAFVFALVLGGIVSCLTIAIAWVFFRPVFGICLLTLTGVGIYFLFFFKPGEE